MDYLISKGDSLNISFKSLEYTKECDPINVIYKIYLEKSLLLSELKQISKISENKYDQNSLFH